MKQTKLPIRLKNRIFSTQEAKKQGLSFYALRKLLAIGAMHKVTRGLYQAKQTDFSEEEMFKITSLKIGSPNAICLVSALSHYQLTDAIPKKIWLMVEASKRTKFPNIRLLRTRNPKWNVGIVKKNGYSITSLERTLIDAIIYRNIIGTNVAMEALRKANKNSNATLGKLIDLAKKLEVYPRVQPYIEALA